MFPLDNKRGGHVTAPNVRSHPDKTDRGRFNKQTLRTLIADDEKLKFAALAETQPFIEGKRAAVGGRNVKERNIATLPVLRHKTSHQKPSVAFGLSIRVSANGADLAETGGIHTLAR